MVHVLRLNHFLDQARATFSSLSLPLLHIPSTVPSMWPPSHYRLIHASMTASIVLFCFCFLYLSVLPNFLIPISSSPHFLHCCHHHLLPSIPLHHHFPPPILIPITFTHHYLPIPSFTLPTIPPSPTPTCIYCYHHLFPSSLLSQPLSFPPFTLHNYCHQQEG